MTAQITIHGGLTGEPEIRYAKNGKAIANGTVASTERYLDKQTNEWTDGKSLYLRWSAFGDIAEHIADSGLEKGSQVVVSGKLLTRQFETRDGESRSVIELNVTDFAVSLKRATAKVNKTTRGDSGGSGGGFGGGGNPWDAGGPENGSGSDETIPF